MRLPSYFAAPAVLALALLPLPAFAQDDDEKVELEEESEDPGDASEEEAGRDSGSEGDEKGEGGDPEADAAAGDNSPVEEPGQTYYFVGARYRGIIVPQFLVGIFADGGRTEYVHAFGPEFGIRKDNFETNLGMWLAFYDQEPTAYKGGSDPERAWELIESEMKILYLTADFLASYPLSDQFAINYGGGAGIGIVFGSLFRTQSYPGPDSDPDDPNTWEKCDAVGIPNPSYCDNENDHYDGYTEPSWFGGGSKPVLFPWLALQTGVRYKPTAKFAARLDLGFGTSGFFFGLGGDYGL